MPLNNELLARIRDHILEEPRRYRQSALVQRHSDESPCGTQACIGGWALELSGIDYYDQDVSMEKTAGELLGFTPKQAQQVFFGNWPEPFDGAWRDCIPREEAAHLAANYINWIIETGRVR